MLEEKLIQKLDEIAAMLKAQEVPLSDRLWSAADIGAYASVKASTVSRAWAPRPDFPRPVRIAGGYPRWYVADVLEWVAGFQDKKRR